jgi:hypothetical protein
VRCGVFFAVRTEFLNVIYRSFGFKGLITYALFISSVLYFSLQRLVRIFLAVLCVYGVAIQMRAELLTDVHAQCPLLLSGLKNWMCRKSLVKRLNINFHGNLYNDFRVFASGQARGDGGRRIVTNVYS